MRGFFHYLVSILMWLLFGYYWYIVSGRQISWGTFQALLVLGFISLAGLILTTVWVRHNQNIARNNTRTGMTPALPEKLEQDHLGRPILAPASEELKQARVISITIDDQGRKIYAAPSGVAI